VEVSDMRGLSRRLRCSAAAVGFVALAACGGEPPPRAIQFNANQLSVVNQTAVRWTNVEVWMNNHYRVTTPALEPGQRLDVPLDAFVAGNGHRFQPKKQGVEGVQVLATGADGKAVRLNWGKGRQWY
jgi:hypothetical protein